MYMLVVKEVSLLQTDVLANIDSVGLEDGSYVVNGAAGNQVM